MLKESVELSTAWAMLLYQNAIVIMCPSIVNIDMNNIIHISTAAYKPNLLLRGKNDSKLAGTIDINSFISDTIFKLQRRKYFISNGLEIILVLQGFPYQRPSSECTNFLGNDL